jgi:hypothetical protein
VEPADIGLHRQLQLFEQVADRLGTAPPVIDAEDFLRAPEAQLKALCEHLGLAFTPRMLSWPKGRRQSDGIWAPHWYAAVEASTGFEPWRSRQTQLPAEAEAVAQDCLAPYLHLRAHRLQTAD